MPHTKKSDQILIIGALSFSGTLGVFNGLYPCPRYSWEIWLNFAVLATLSLIPMFFATRVLTSWSHRILFPVGILFVTMIFGSLAAPFYPATPPSFSDYMQSFEMALRYGPCG
jgi:hypothetical protein